MKILRWIGLALASLILGVVLVAFAARFGDGPLGPFPGGELEAGEWADADPEDWTFATDVNELDLQLEEPPGSRRTWLVVHEGGLYIPCGLPNQLKRWPHDARKDGRAIMRMSGKLYRVQLEYVADLKLATAVGKLSSRKYGFEERDEIDPEVVWYFSVRARRG